MRQGETKMAAKHQRMDKDYYKHTSRGLQLPRVGQSSFSCSSQQPKTKKR